MSEESNPCLWLPTKKKTYSKCLRCGRMLKSEEARERGFGKICWEKRLLDNQGKLF